MIFQSFRAKFCVSNHAGIQQCISKILPFSTSALFEAKSTNRKNTELLQLQPINRQSKKKPEQRESYEKEDQSKNNPKIQGKQSSVENRLNVDSYNEAAENFSEIPKSINTNQVSEKVTNILLSNHKPEQNLNLSSNTNIKSTDLVAIAIEKLTTKSCGDWDNVRNFILKNERNRGGKYTINNIDANILGYCMSIQRCDLAYSYFKYLGNHKLKPNLATIAKYLKVLYYRNIEGCSKQDEEEILALYENICKEFPVLESNSLNSLILALSVTKEWKKTLDLLEEVRRLTLPSKAAYSAIVAAMFLNKEENSAWALLDEMFENDKCPSSEAFLHYLNGIKKLRKNQNIEEKLEKLFKFFETTEMRCPEDVAQIILEICQKKFVGNAKVKISLNGVCQNCRKKLEKSDLTETEFEQLKHKFMKNVILGKDLFLKTDPSELSKFKEFLECMEEFDVVLDGLNIAYSTGDNNPHVQAKLLCSVIQHYRENNKSILVLGRVHMKNWPKESWKYIVENCSVFLTRNLSQDDPYLLYCALNSGKNTIIVTRDLMRSHKFLLKDVKFKRLFQKWLDQRQHCLLTIGKNGQPIFKKPPDFCPIAQKNEDIWHIPYESSIEGINEHYHKTWLCLNLK